MTPIVESAADSHTVPARLPVRHYLNAGYAVRSWLVTTDHKRIAILHLLSITFFFVIGGMTAPTTRSTTHCRQQPAAVARGPRPARQAALANALRLFKG